MAGALVSKTTISGLRPVDLRTDLGGIADLIEMAFGPTMDESGRANIREMRMISNSPSLAAINANLDRLIGGFEQGFVWIEQGKIVGNVTISPANYPRSLGKGAIIANVAVYPEYRRRGIAEVLVSTALDTLRVKRQDFAILQVDATNDVAQRLYRRLGFHEERTFVRWVRTPHMRPPQLINDLPEITLRQGHDWKAELHLAELVRPNSRGGLGWMRPVHPQPFRPSILTAITDWITAHNEDHWIVRTSNGSDLIASLRVVTSFGSSNRMELLVHPMYMGKLEEPLINHGLRLLEGRRNVVIEHPDDDWAATMALQKYGFERRYTLIHMKNDL